MGRANLGRRNPTDGHRKNSTGTNRADADRPARRRPRSGAARADLTVGAVPDTLDDRVLPGTSPPPPRPSTATSFGCTCSHASAPSGSPPSARATSTKCSATWRGQLDATRRIQPNGAAPGPVRATACAPRAEAEGLITRNAAALSNRVRQDRTEGRSLTPTSPSTARRGPWPPPRGRHRRRADLRTSAVRTAGPCMGRGGARPPDPRLTVRRSLKRVPNIGLVLSDTKTNRSRRVVHLTRPLRRFEHTEPVSHRPARAGGRWLNSPSAPNPLPRGVNGGRRTRRVLARSERRMRGSRTWSLDSPRTPPQRRLAPIGLRRPAGPGR